MNPDRHAVLFAGIAAAAFVALLQLSTADKLNYGHRVAVLCFALVLPIAAIFGTWPPNWKRSRFPGHVRKAQQPIGIITIMIFCAGIAAVLFSFGAVGVIPFSISGAVTLWLMHHGQATDETPK